MAPIHRAIAFIILGISALLLSAYLFFNENNISMDSFKDVHFSKYLPSGFLTKFHYSSNNYIYAKLKINGSFLGDISFNLHDTNVKVNGRNIDIGTDDGRIITISNVSLENFTGSINYGSDGYCNLDGDVKKILFPYGLIQYDSKESIYINQTINSMNINNFYQDKIVLGGFRGIIDVKVKGDTISYLTSNKDVKITNMKGKLFLSQNRIFFDGEGVIKTDVLLTPLS